MSVDTNRFGLTRDIPADVARQIRRSSGFGCVVCGCALYDYEHVDPEFKDAERHDPTRIALVCPNHHRSKGAFTSLETLKAAMADPYSMRHGYSRLSLDVNDCCVTFGPYIVEQSPVILSIRGQPAIWLDQPEEVGAPFLLSAKFNSQGGETLCGIEQNRWYAAATNFDVQIIAGNAAGTLEIRKDKRTVIFRMEVRPPKQITISHLDTWDGNLHIVIRPDGDASLLEMNGRPKMRGSDEYVTGWATGVNLG